MRVVGVKGSWGQVGGVKSGRAFDFGKGAKMGKMFR